MISLIVAHDEKLGIGIDNELPWRLPKELDHFKFLTIGKPVIMGRKTYESIGKPLPGRLNIVVTRQEDYEVPEGVLCVPSVKEAFNRLTRALNTSEVMVIGGQQIYEEALPFAHRIYATQLQWIYECNKFFPAYEQDFKQVYRGDLKGESQTFYRYTIYDRTH